MKNLKKFFVHYPNKKQRPSLKGLCLGTLYDFGLIWIIQAMILLYFIEISDDPVIGDANRKIRLLLLLISIFQFLFLELVVWMGIYFFAKKAPKA